MQDRPSVLELLEAVERFLAERVVAETEGTLKFHARVSVNVLRIVRRELEQEEDHLAREWAGLDDLLGEEQAPPTLAGLKQRLLARNEAIATRIRAGDADEGENGRAIFEHVQRVVRDKAAVADPRLLDP